MARKNLLKGLMEQAAEGSKEPKTEPKPAEKPYSKGAIGAVSRSIADLKSRSVVDLDPFSIKGGGLMDRLEHDEEDHARLMESISIYGQQVPILVRPMPKDVENPEGDYQIVYGRRRVLALRDLGLPVKAMIRDLDDAEVIMAQGQENTARRDLSFIEKVNFARQMNDADYDRKAISDALNTDKTAISRMLTVAEALPVELIEMVGAAPGVGRDKWVTFAKLWVSEQGDVDTAQAMITANAAEASDDRFDALYRWMEKRRDNYARPKTAKKAPVTTRTLHSEDGAPLADVKRSQRKMTIEMPPDTAFGNWLEAHLADIHRNWVKSREGE